MRTAEEIFKDNVRGWQLSITNKGMKAIIEAMKIYAKEAIEECADNAEVETQNLTEGGYLQSHTVNKKSILELINELK